MLVAKGARSSRRTKWKTPERPTTTPAPPTKNSSPSADWIDPDLRILRQRPKAPKPEAKDGERARFRNGNEKRLDALV